MRLRLLPWIILTAAAPARAAQAFYDVSAAAGAGSALVSSVEGGTTFDKDRYRIAARVRTSRLGAEAPGMREEYSASLTRELYHILVSGRLGTSPPSSQGAGYHLAAGEAWFKFYGWDVGPEHPELSPVVWESSGSVPDFNALDRTWITRVGGSYANVNNHVQTANGLFILVDGVWSFTVLETYREIATLGFQGGGNRYNKTLDGNSPAILQNVVDYWGNYLPIAGWPNGWQSLRFSRRLGAVELTAAATRLNMLAGSAVTMGALEASWAPDEDWTLRAGIERIKRAGGSERSALALGLGRRW